MESWKINHLGKINLTYEELSAEGKVKVKVSKALLDNTDLNLLKGEGNRYPITPSHIAIGNVSEEYPELGLKFGEKVLLSPYLASGVSHDRKVYIAPNVDVMGIDCDGFLKDFVAINRENVYILPDSVSETEALFVENIALGVKIFSDLDIEKGETVVIIGGSSLGILLCQLAIYYQTIPILIDTDDERLSIATDMGVYYTVNPREADVLGQILSFTSGRMADFVVYDPNTDTPLQPAMQYCRKQGKIAIVGHKKTKATVELSKLLANQLQLIGINNGYDEIATAINLLATKSIDPSFIQAKTIEFEDVGEAIEEYVIYPNADTNVIVNVK
mgnify:FL=1